MLVFVLLMVSVLNAPEYVHVASC